MFQPLWLINCSYSEINLMGINKKFIESSLTLFFLNPILNQKRGQTISDVFPKYGIKNNSPCDI